MTDFTDDELVSAVLDGEATDEEAAHVRADPALSARLVELRAARDAIAVSVPLPMNEQRDALIAAAMTSADAAADADAAARPADELRERRRRRALRVASVAAAVLAVAGIIGAIAALASRDSRKADTSAAGQAASSPVTTAQAPQSTPPFAADGGAAQAAAGASSASVLGSFQTPQELVEAVKTHITPATQNVQSAPTIEPSASFLVPPCRPRTDVIYVARASLSGQPVTVIVSGRAGQQTIEVDDLNCAVVFTQPL
jgi:hypothetical protein